MKIRECDSVEEIVAEEGGESISEIVFNVLEALELESLPKLKLFSSSNCLLRLPRLNKLVIRQCPRMKSFSMSEISAPKLRKIQTDRQEGKWCWEGDLNRTVDKIFQDKVALSSFNHLELSKYPELEELLYGQVGQKTFCKLNHLVVRQCTFLSNVLFSSNLWHLLYTLEELEVAECDSLEAVFDVKALDDKAIESKEVSRLKKLILSRLSKLKSIWNAETGEIISFENLQIMKVDNCPNLKYLFSSSLCQDLRQLEELNIESCGLEQIIANEEGLEELEFYFPLLRIFRLVCLTQLNYFYPKRYTLECPSLKILNVYLCEALQIFAFGHLDPQQLRGLCDDLPMQQALFHINKVSENLEELSLHEKDAMRILNGNYEKKLFQRIKFLRLQYFQKTPMKFLNDLIQKIPAISTLQARRSSFETLFPSKETCHCGIESPTQIKTLSLLELEQLEHIWNDDDSASHPIVENLENLSITECSRIIRLAPPSASFRSLTSMIVKNCNGLMNFMTTCTAKSLVHLIFLQVSNCGMLEEAVMTDEGESEEEITFESLEYLELNCLSSFKSFCTEKHTFIFPSLVILKVIGCQKMKNFSSGLIISPFLKLVEVENGKKCWKKDLNTTIKQIFIDKAIGEGVEGNYRESLNVSTSRALSSEEHREESKTNKIIDLGINIQKINEITKTPVDHASQNTLSLSKADRVIGIREMHKTTEEDVAQDAQSTLRFTIVQDAGVGTQETQESKRRFLVHEAQHVLSTPMVHDTAIGTEEMNETIQTPFTKVAESTIIHTSVQEAVIERPLVQATHQGPLSPSIVQDTDVRNQEMYKLLEKALVTIVQNVLRSSKVDNRDGSQDLQLHPSENLLDQATTSTMNDDEENTENKDIHETIQGPLVQNAEDTLITTSVHDIASGTYVTHENIHKPFAQATQNTWDITIVQTKGESYDSDIHLSKNLFHQSITSSMVTDYKKTVRTQETYESKRRFSAHDAQNVLSPIHHTATDPAPSQASKAPSSSTTPLADVCSNFKELDISVRLLPYLEAGVKQHPQVLNWLNTKRRTVFASSSFSLFAEVTRILRTTRRVNLTEDDRSYIRECCTVLQGVGFDDGWISYVLRRIEVRADGEDLEWKVEEAEAKLESINKELASMEESLGLLRDKTRRLHGYICLSTVINALLFIMLFLFIIYVYQKKY